MGSMEGLPCENCLKRWGLGPGRGSGRRWRRVWRRGWYRLELLEKARRVYSPCAQEVGKWGKANRWQTLRRDDILQTVWMLSLWLQKVPQPHSWKKTSLGTVKQQCSVCAAGVLQDTNFWSLMECFESLESLFTVCGVIWGLGYLSVVRLYTWSSPNWRQKWAGQQKSCPWMCDKLVLSIRLMMGLLCIQLSAGWLLQCSVRT